MNKSKKSTKLEKKAEKKAKVTKEEEESEKSISLSSEEEEIPIPIESKKVSGKRKAAESTKTKPNKKDAKKKIEEPKEESEEILDDPEEDVEDAKEESTNKPQEENKEAPQEEVEEEKKEVDEEENKEAPEEAPVESDEVELFIGNLPFSTTDEEVRDFFKASGKIASVKLIQRNGRPSGRGFIKFVAPQSAAKAKGLDGQDFNGRAIIVRYASEPPPERGPRQGYNSGSGQTAVEGTTIFVGNLSFDSTQDAVTNFFSQCGNITSVRLATDQEGNPRGFAHVEFDSNDAVKEALKLTGQDLDGRNIRIDVAASRRNDNRQRGGFSGRGRRGRSRGNFGNSY